MVILDTFYMSRLFDIIYIMTDEENQTQLVSDTSLQGEVSSEPIKEEIQMAQLPPSEPIGVLKPRTYSVLGVVT